MTRVLVTGGAGQLAKAIREEWPDMEVLLPDERELDLSRKGAIHEVLGKLNPEILVNAGALTSVDRCESESQLAYLINGKAVGWLADACSETNTLLIQISTDYVFDGQSHRPYREDDPPNPNSVYGKSKLVGERAASASAKHLIVRTAWLYDAWGRNFLRTMLNAASQGRAIRVVDDQWGCPTSCRALARQLKVAVEEGWRGVVHGTCSGETTWFRFAHEIFQRTGINVDLSPCSTDEYPLPAPRPPYSVLDGSRRAILGSDLMPPWQEALAEVLIDLEQKEN